MGELRFDPHNTPTERGWIEKHPQLGCGVGGSGAVSTMLPRACTTKDTALVAEARGWIKLN